MQNERLIDSMEGASFNKMEYILEKKDNKTEVILKGEFDDERNKKMLKKASDILLKSLKKFVEYVRKGGNIEKYNKKQK